MQFTITMQTLDEVASLITFLKKDSNKPVEANIPLKIDPVAVLDRRNQGRYVGLIRHLSPSARVKVKKVRKERGLQYALDYGLRLKAAPKLPSNGGTKRHRKTCDWCTRSFLAHQRRSHFCSKSCRDADYRQRSSKAKADAS